MTPAVTKVRADGIPAQLTVINKIDVAYMSGGKSPTLTHSDSYQ